MKITEASTYRFIAYAPQVDLYCVIVPRVKGGSGYVGHYTTLDEAIQARDKAAL